MLLWFFLKSTSQNVKSWCVGLRLSSARIMGRYCWRNGSEVKIVINPVGNFQEEIKLKPHENYFCGLVKMHVITFIEPLGYVDMMMVFQLISTFSSHRLRWFPARFVSHHFPPIKDAVTDAGTGNVKSMFHWPAQFHKCVVLSIVTVELPWCINNFAYCALSDGTRIALWLWIRLATQAHRDNNLFTSI